MNEVGKVQKSLWKFSTTSFKITVVLNERWHICTGYQSERHSKLGLTSRNWQITRRNLKTGKPSVVSSPILLLLQPGLWRGNLQVLDAAEQFVIPSHKGGHGKVLVIDTAGRNRVRNITFLSNPSRTWESFKRFLRFSRSVAGLWWLTCSLPFFLTSLKRRRESLSNFANCELNLFSRENETHTNVLRLTGRTWLTWLFKQTSDNFTVTTLKYILWPLCRLQES